MGAAWVRESWRIQLLGWGARIFLPRRRGILCWRLSPRGIERGRGQRGGSGMEGEKSRRALLSPGFLGFYHAAVGEPGSLTKHLARLGQLLQAIERIRIPRGE